MNNEIARMGFDEAMAVLEEKLETEMEAFRNSYKTMDRQAFYNDWYIIGFYESYYEMLVSGDMANRGYGEKICSWLASFDNPLRFLYDEWLSCDDALSLDWHDMYCWLENLHEEFMREAKEAAEVPLDEQISAAESLKAADGLGADNRQPDAFQEMK